MKVKNVTAYSYPFLLTLPVRRYLVPAHLVPVHTNGGREGGGGWADSLMISKKVDSTNFNIGKPLGLSMRGKKMLVFMI